jgi:hypothetical protein
MKPAFVKEIAHDFAEALRVNPLAVRDVQELLEALSLCHADFVSADVPEADLRALADISPGSKPARREPAALEFDRRAPPVE